VQAERLGQAKLAPGLELRPLVPDDDLEAEVDLRRRSFGPVPAGGERPWLAALAASISAGRVLGVFDGRRLVASARHIAMRQWWHGRPIAMAGLAGVKVAPEERGRGVGRALVTTVLHQLADQGCCLSALYPSTMPLYRSLGWEVAGGRYEAVLPTASLSSLLAADQHVPGPRASAPARTGVRRATSADAGTIIEVLGRVHEDQRDSGPATREAWELIAWLDDVDHFAYLADDGFLSYGWADGHDQVRVDYLVAGSATTAREFLAILASHASMADTVRACLAPDDSVGWLTREPVSVTSRVRDWMLRVIDPAQAIAARGYPACVSLDIALELDDPVFPARSGHWLLEIAGGEGKLTPGAGSERNLRLGARGFAALFAGVPAGTLRRAGLVAGGDRAADEALNAAFTGPAFMYDYF
jgi:predicted acetyltransferase